MIQSIEKAMAMLSALASNGGGLTLAELADELALPKPTAHRYVTSLVECGLAAQLEGGGYTLGFRLIELGEAARTKFSLGATCLPIMRKLLAQTGETVMLAVADWPAGAKMTLERLDTHHAVSAQLPIGRRTTIRSGLFGKALLMGVPPDEVAAALAATPAEDRDIPKLGEDVLLAAVERYREQGYATQEHGEGPYPDVSGVSVPVAVQGGRPLGAIGLFGPSTRIDPRLRELGEILVELTAPLRPRDEHSQMLAGAELG